MGALNILCQPSASPIPVYVFARECKGEAHEPCDCETWKLWLQKVTEMRPEECECSHYLSCFTSCISDMKLQQNVQPSVS